jgi:hypothetical protein
MTANGFISAEDSLLNVNIKMVSNYQPIYFKLDVNGLLSKSLSTWQRLLYTKQDTKCMVV